MSKENKAIYVVYHTKCMDRKDDILKALQGCSVKEAFTGKFLRVECDPGFDVKEALSAFPVVVDRDKLHRINRNP